MTRSLLSKRLWLNVALLGLLFLLGGVAYWWQDRQATPTINSLLTIPVAQVERLLIERDTLQPGKDRLAFSKQDEQWMMTEPEALPANRLQIRQLLTLIEEPVQGEYATEGKNLTTYGLSPAQVSVQVNQELLLLGDSNPVSQSRYVLHAGRIKLVPEAMFDLLMAEWHEYVALKLLPDDQVLTYLTWGDGKVADPELLQQWQQAEAFRVERVNPSDFKTQDNTVSLQFQQGQQQVWQLQPQLHALDNLSTGLRYYVTEKQWQALVTPISLAS